jgi:hypothetical protein
MIFFQRRLYEQPCIARVVAANMPPFGSAEGAASPFQR